MKIPLVAIVGRPNVGKSTLFNRLIGKREAIVDDLSGVTRDRHYSEVEWNTKYFRLIDTGGYVPESPNLFEKAIREQISAAIAESNKIIFLVDARDGVTPADAVIAQLLRSSHKEVLLAVNKVDSEKFESSAHEFYELGFGEPIPVSATVGRNIGDFLDLITNDFPLMKDIEIDERLKIAIVGRPNVGKSSLTNALLGFDRSIVTDIPGTTRDSVDSILKYYGEEIVLIDTAGLRKKSKVDESIEFFSSIRTMKAISESEITVILIDATLGLENQDQKIIDEAVSRRKGIILAVNKWDLVEKETNTAHEYEVGLRQKLGNIDYLPIVFISALTKQRVFKLIELAKQIQSERKKKISTNELIEFIGEETKKLPPPSSPTGREVRIKYVTLVGDHYPIFLFFCNYPKSVTESYKRFLEKAIRRQYGFIGVPFTLSFKEK
jgi:GTP-binding protein